MRLDKFVQSVWYSPSHWLSHVLLPGAWLFQIITRLRCWAYQRGLLQRHSFNVPVIVVGNITVGGSGKTPLIIHLAQWLKQQGFKPGIVSRGYGGKVKQTTLVTANSNPRWVGDETVLIASRTQCPVMVDANRPKAVAKLISSHHCDVILSDDGLQHYALDRHIEIVVINHHKGLGNKRCLPAGPLRESEKRLKQVDFVIINGDDSQRYAMTYANEPLYQLIDISHKKSITAFAHNAVHAVAGIGDPQKFFSTLEKNDIHITPHSFSDHYQYSAKDLDFSDNQPIIMTEKDAVKCQFFANEKMWVLPISTHVSQNFLQDLLQHLMTIKSL